MPNITISIPTVLVADIKAALSQLYGGNVMANMSAREQLVYHLQKSLGPTIKAIRQRQIDITALEEARLVAEAAQKAEEEAVSTQQKSLLSQAEIDLGGIS